MPRLNWSKRLFGNQVTVSALALVGSAFTLVIAFQNCGKAGFDSATQSSLNSSNPADSTPFAYEASVDMITYNSCASPSSQGKTFTFKVGSYDSKNSTTGTVGNTILAPKGGVKIRQDFINYADSVLKPDYPNPSVTAAQVQRLLGESKLNSSVVPQLSVRSIFKGLRLNNVFSRTNTPSLGIDVLPLLGNLANPTWSEILLSKAYPKKSKIEYTDFFPGTANAQSRIEGEFGFNSNEQTAEEYRNAFNKLGSLDAQIVLGFSYEGEGVLMTPGDADAEVMTSAYGRGYQLSFGMPTDTITNGGTYWSWRPNNIVTKVEEYDLETNQKVANVAWDCTKFRIVRQEDAHFEWTTAVNAIGQAVTVDSNIPSTLKETYKVNIETAMSNYYLRSAGATQAGFCPKMNYNTLLSIPPQNSVYGIGAFAGKSYAQILEMVRRHLPASDWDINLEYGCVVPKKFSCYQDQARKATEDGTYYGKFRVANTTWDACNHPFDSNYSKANQTADNGALPIDWCNEFVSVCMKR